MQNTKLRKLEIMNWNAGGPVLGSNDYDTEKGNSTGDTFAGNPVADMIKLISSDV